MSKKQITEIQIRKKVKKSQQSQQSQKNKQIEGSQSQGTQQLERSFDKDKGHQNIVSNKKDQVKVDQKNKILEFEQIRKPSENDLKVDISKKSLSKAVFPSTEYTKTQYQEIKQEFKVIPKKQQSSKKYSELKITDLLQNRRPIHILAVSDNHGDYKAMNHILDQKGDIFIHAGKDEDFQKFFTFLDKIKFRHKIVIAGNHQNVLSKFKLKTTTKMSKQKIISQLKKRCTYLQHEQIEIEGVKIFASPYTPQYCQKPTSRAFQYKPSNDKIIWKNIPKDIDLLITHGPPFGILDNGKNGKHAGSQSLKQVVLAIKPKYHIFGHIHESKGGMMKIGETTFFNLCNSPTRFTIKF